jgi:hypothetical protein
MTKEPENSTPQVIADRLRVSALHEKITTFSTIAIQIACHMQFNIKSSRVK